MAGELEQRRAFLVSKDVVIPLGDQQPVVLGRDIAACNFVLSDDRVSRVHAMILFREGHFLIKDLNSSNGTIVNGRRLTGTAALKPGDRIAINPFSLEFVQPQSAPAESRLEMPYDTRNKFEGSIATLPISDLIQLLNATQQSGLLVLTDALGRQADLVFVEGEVVEAHFDGKSGEQAVFALLRERRGRFEFTKTERLPLSDKAAHPSGAGLALVAADAASGDKIVRKTQSLLLEGVRLIDESMTPATVSLHNAGPTTRDSSTAPDMRAFGNLVD